jgi:hypothetical protein
MRKDGSLHRHHSVVGEGEEKVLEEGIPQVEGELIVMIFATAK